MWAADVLTLLNAIQHSGVTPHAWHVDLMHYVHKGGEDSSLPNHRPLTLVDVLRKAFSAVSTSRMRRDWTRLRIPDTCNPGFEPGPKHFFPSQAVSLRRGNGRCAVPSLAARVHRTATARRPSSSSDSAELRCPLSMQVGKWVFAMSLTKTCFTGESRFGRVIIGVRNLSRAEWGVHFDTCAPSMHDTSRMLLAV